MYYDTQYYMYYDVILPRPLYHVHVHVVIAKYQDADDPFDLVYLRKMKCGCILILQILNLVPVI